MLLWHFNQHHSLPPIFPQRHVLVLLRHVNKHDLLPPLSLKDMYWCYCVILTNIIVYLHFPSATCIGAIGHFNKHIYFNILNLMKSVRKNKNKTMKRKKEN